VETTYEVYVRNKGQTRWNLQEQYGEGEKERAVDDAKRLEAQQSVDAVRVVREIFYPDTNETKDFVVYMSKKKKKTDGPPPDHSQPGGADADRDDNKKKSKGKKPAGVAEAAPAPATPKAAAAAVAVAPKRKTKGAPVIVKMIIIVLASVAFATLVTLAFVAILLG
jgi:hypothetical protein